GKCIQGHHDRAPKRAASREGARTARVSPGIRDEDEGRSDPVCLGREPLGLTHRHTRQYRNPPIVRNDRPAGSLALFTGEPWGAMEALNEILGAMKLSGAVILGAELSAPWCVRSKIDPDDCRPFTRVPEQIIAYHYVLEGGLVLKLGDGEPIEATRNDLVIVSRNEPHVLGSAVDLAPADANDLIEQATDGGPARIRHGGGGARTRILCGFLGSSD